MVDAETARALPVAALGASPLAKAIVASFAYHPFGQNDIWWTDDGWAIGPTFCVKVDDGTYAEVLLGGGYLTYKEDSVMRNLAQAILMGPLVNMALIEEVAAAHQEVLVVDSKGHEMAQTEVTLNDGSVALQGKTKCTARALHDPTGSYLELAFPHVKLVKALKPDTVMGYSSEYLAKIRSGRMTKSPMFPEAIHNTVSLMKGGAQIGFIVAKTQSPLCRPT